MKTIKIEFEMNVPDDVPDSDIHDLKVVIKEKAFPYFNGSVYNNSTGECLHTTEDAIGWMSCYSLCEDFVRRYCN